MKTLKTGWFPPHGSQRDREAPEPSLSIHPIQPSASIGHQTVHQQHVGPSSIASQKNVSSVTDFIRFRAPNRFQAAIGPFKVEIKASLCPDAERDFVTKQKAKDSSSGVAKGNALASKSRDFDFTYNQHRRLVLKLAQELFISREDQEDLESAVMMSAFKHFRSFDPIKGNFSTWIATIVRNEATNMHRRKAKSPPAISFEAGACEIRNQTLAHQDWNPSLAIDWKKLIEEIPQSYWEAFQKVAIQGYSCEEVALEMGATVGTIRTYVWRARKLLKNLAVINNLAPSKLKKVDA